MDFLRKNRTVVFVCCAIAVFAIGTHIVTKPEQKLITSTVETGDVVSSVTVSGIAEATKAARLRFPDTGRIADILVTKGDTVSSGDVLALLDQGDIEAERREAMAGLSRALASRDELVNGPTDEKREVVSVSVEQARAELQRVQEEEAAKVAAARRTYLGSDLELVPEKLDTNDTPPTVGGAYTCGEGSYTIEVYRSGALSGYSYRVSGLESGTYTAYTDVAGPFGSCGLTLQFDPDEVYRAMKWTLSIPNPRGENFIANQNALTLAEERERVAINKASDALTEALAGSNLDLADPRNEALRQADADIDAALARVARVDALRERRVLRAPFDGTITDIIPNVGEVTPASDPVVIMVSSNAFELIARVPEIDITKVSEGNDATLIFDAKDTERVAGRIVFLSPLASPIDGVAYFDATVGMDTVPEWVREGLNADVLIVVDKRTNVPRIPRRFLTEREGTHYATLVENGSEREVKVNVDLVGTDGYAAVDLPVGTTVAVPEATP